MIRSSSLPLAYALLLLLPVLLAPLPALGQEAEIETDIVDEETTDIAELQRQLHSLTRNQAKMQGTLERIEAKLSNLERQPSEFSRVMIHVQTTDGERIEGYDFHLFSERGEGQKARAKGTSDAEGKALDRFMPYGDYILSVSGFGWSTHFRGLHVELQEPLELTVIAPDPQAVGTLQLVTALSREAFASLPFGTVTQSRRGNAYSFRYVTEPEELDEDRLPSYPRLDHGITTTGVVFDINATASLEQPGGDIQNWSWTPELARAVSPLLATPEGLLQFDGRESMRRSPRAGSRFYSSIGDEKRILLTTMRPRRHFDNPLTLKCPAGEIEITVDQLLGRAAPQVADAMFEANELRDRTLWLPVRFRDDSEWLARLFSLDAWQVSDNIRWMLKRTVDLEQGQTATVVLASPGDGM